MYIIYLFLDITVLAAWSKKIHHSSTAQFLISVQEVPQNQFHAKTTVSPKQHIRVNVSYVLRVFIVKWLAFQSPVHKVIIVLMELG
jgi:hypothetical protein